MKKLLCVLWISLALAGCGDEAKEAANSSKSAVEKTAVIEDVKSVAEKAPEVAADNKTESETPAVKAESAVEKQAVSAKQEAEHIHAKAKKKFSAQTSKHKVTPAESSEEYVHDGLSPEERRVGAQPRSRENPVDVEYEKMQCRYPYMTQEERRANHCY